MQPAQTDGLGSRDRRVIRVAAILLLTLLCTDGSMAYSVLTHEKNHEPGLGRRTPSTSAQALSGDDGRNNSKRHTGTRMRAVI